MRILAVADSDSYLKWGASVLDRLPADWQHDLTVVATPVVPSGRQRAAALAGSGYAGHAVPVQELREIAERIAVEEPDAVLLALRGPVVRVAVRAIVAASARRPVLVSGLPGISIPATMKALYYRSQVDLMLLQSKREITAFREVAAEHGFEQDFALGSLPFLPAPRERALGDDIVFAAQAKVPRTLDERRELIAMLVDTARRHPDRRVVLKLRALAGEQQTHLERYPLDTLLDELDAPPNLVVETGPMLEHLQRASGLVTVSSTAAIEAVALGVPVLVLDDFGVSARNINLVFEGSGLFGGADDLRAARFHHPESGWLDENYFHPGEDDDWAASIAALVARRDAAALPLRRQVRGTLGGNLRRVWDRKRALGAYDRSLGGLLALAVGLPLRRVVLVLRRLRRASTGAAAPARSSPAEFRPSL